MFIDSNREFFILTTFQELFQIVIGAIIIPAYLFCVQLSRLYPTANGLYACIEFLANFFQIIQLYIRYFNQSLSPHFVKILTNTFCWWKNIDGLGGRKLRFYISFRYLKSAWWWSFPTPLLIFKIAFSSPKKDYPIEKKMCFAYSYYIKLLSISQQLLYNCCISII